MKIVIAEPLAAAGVKLLESQTGWEVVQSNPREYMHHLAEADGLIVRGSIRLSGAVIAQAPRLRVVGRAGVTVENIDLAAATSAGVLVMNTPGGNAVSVAEHALALMLSLARSIPLANASTKAGKWERRKFSGVELRGKTLGVLGLGTIGREVVRRALPFEMRILATDPYAHTGAASDLGIELVPIETLYAESDFLTLHVALTPETHRMLSTDAFARMKTGVRIINCARGELIDELALEAALQFGKVAGAALDVFQCEPPEGSSLLKRDNVIATPHIGGATEEAQEVTGVRIAAQIVDYLKNGIALNAVNMPALTREQHRTLGPWVDLGERLGRLASYLARGNPQAVRIHYYGKLSDQDTHLIRNSVLAGVLARGLHHRANVINAMQLAHERGLDISETHDQRSAHTDSIRVELATSAGPTRVDGAVVFGKPRLIRVDDIPCEAPLEGNVTFLRNQDVPGVIGHVGRVLGEQGVNIASFALGRRDAMAEAVSVVVSDQPVSEATLERVLENPAVTEARFIEFPR